MKYHSTAVLSLCLGTLLSVTATSGARAADLDSLIASCQDCHGKDGASTEKEIPIIGGLSAIYIEDSLAAYRDETRACVDVKYPAGEHKGETSNMCKAVEKLSEEEDTQLAEHFEALPFVRVEQAFDAALVSRGEEIHDLKCKKCHEDGGSSPDDDAGILAGQWTHYLEDQFEDYASGKRLMPEKMKPKFEELSEEDKHALLQYYASFR